MIKKIGTIKHFAVFEIMTGIYHQQIKMEDH